MTTRQCLFECDQCTYREWRPEEQEPWLCVVCGYMRWSVVAVGERDEDGEQDASAISTGRGKT